MDYQSVIRFLKHIFIVTVGHLKLIMEVFMRLLISNGQQIMKIIFQTLLTSTVIISFSAGRMVLMPANCQKMM